MSTATSLYRPLDPARSEIRLLEIVSDDEQLDDPHHQVCCRLSTVSLDDHPRFVALSYPWGDPDITRPISLTVAGAAAAAASDKPVGETVVVEVTVNLESALRKARDGSSSNRGSDPAAFRLWADAICINQDDISERQAQVEMMGRVYKSARLVIGWFGPCDLSIAFDALKTIHREICNTTDAEFNSLKWITQYPDLCQGGIKEWGQLDVSKEDVRQAFGKESKSPIQLPDNETWTNIADLFRHPYWDRVWILQERVLARRLLFLTEGAGSISWRKVQAAASRMHDLKQMLQQSVVTRPPWIWASAWSFLMDEGAVGWNAVFLTEMRREIGRELEEDSSDLDLNEKDASDIERIRRYSLWLGALLASTMLKAMDPRDQVYGILGIFDLGISPDYSGASSGAQIYLDLTRGFLRGCQDMQMVAAARGHSTREFLCPLFFLLFAGTGRGSDPSDFPSWVPNLHYHAHNPWRKFSLETSAAHKRVFRRNQRSWPTISRNCLFVRGVDVDQVHTVYRPFQIALAGNSTLAAILVDVLGQHQTYPTGISTQRALVHLLFRDTKCRSDTKSIYEALGFIHLLYFLCLMSPPKDVAVTFWSSLGLLGWEADDGVEESFNAWFVKTFFPGLDLKKLGFDLNLLLLLGTLREEFEDLVMGPAFVAALEFDTKSSVFVTVKGYLGLAPPSTKPGDRVCILDQCPVPAILRGSTRAGQDHVSLVGTGFVVGLMNGEAAELVDRGEAKIEVFRIR